MLKTFLWALAATAFVEARISRDGTCAGTARNTCLGSSFGDCCSQYGWCGSTQGYCGAGCNPLYGACSIAVSPSSSQVSATPSRISSSTRTASSASPSSTLKVSTNARCGYAFDASPGGMTCLGSKYGDCCSQYSYCGSTGSYCGTGCQAGFGKCNAQSSSSARASSTSSSGTVSSSSRSSSTSQASTQSSTTIASTSSQASSSTSSSISSTTLSSTTSTVQSTISSTIPSSTTTDTPTTAVTTSTALSSATPSSTPLRPYTRVWGPANACVYNRYIGYNPLGPDVGSASDQYLAGRTACARSCDGTPTCVFWFFYFDAQSTSPNAAAWCLTDNALFDPAYVQCNIPFSGYNAGYNLAA